MKVSINIPDDLLKSVLKVAKTKSKTEAIIRALNDFVRNDNASKLVRYRGKIDLNIDSDILRDRKNLL